MNRFTESLVPCGTFGFVIAVVAPLISMIHFDSLPISRELNGRTRTATFTEDILLVFFYYFRSIFRWRSGIEWTDNVSLNALNYFEFGI